MWYLYQGIITLFVAILMVNLILNLRALHRLGKERGELPDPLPLISILIPARNEESDIVTCLDSLRRQDYPSFEILVLDDGSTDRTAAVVEEIAAVDPRVRLLRGKPLPRGWAGKPFGCHQLATEARGSWLLFTDADTIHAPQMLRSALSYAGSNRLALLSGFPLQNTISFSQRIVIPIMYFILLSGVPLWWLQGSTKPKPGIAIGQFLFFSARDYREIGGHEAVKSRLMEDVWMGFEVARRGKRQGVVDLSPLVACGTYEGVGDLWQALSRWTYSVTALSPWLFGLLVVVASSLFIAPFFLMAGHFTPLLPDYGWSMLIATQVVVVLMMRVLVDHRFHQSGLYSLSHPAGISLWLLCGVHGAMKRLSGIGMSWKQRHYERDSGVG
jgi:chlorobactene glucosyltransferase